MTEPAHTQAASRPTLLRPGAFGFLGSLELAFLLIGLLTLACLAGAFIPQNQPPEFYLDKFGPRWFAYFTVLGFTDLFYSPWFRSLTLLFGFNLLFCTLERLPSALKRAAGFEPGKVGPARLGWAQWQAELRPPEGRDLADWRPWMLNLAGEVAGPLKEEQTPWGRLHWADRGRFSPLGPYLIHLSLLMFMLAALMGQIWGYSGFLTLAEGESSRVIEGRRPARNISLPFTIGLDKFHLDLHPSDPNGRAVDEYRSQVTITEDGLQAGQAEIKVNHPLTRRGITFYQSSYGRSGGLVHLDASDSNGRKVHLDMKPGRIESLPDGTEVKILDFKTSLMKVGPAALLEIKAEGRPTVEEWFFQTRPSFAAPALGPWDFAITGFEPAYLSTFQVVKDPGVPVVWLACLVMAAGFTLTYLRTRRRLVVLEIFETAADRPRFLAAVYSSRNKKTLTAKGRLLAEAVNNPAEV